MKKNLICYFLCVCIAVICVACGSKTSSEEIGQSSSSGEIGQSSSSEEIEENTYEIALNEEEWTDAYKEEWNYPIATGTEEWNNMKYQQQLAACNMPQDLLEMISTQELVQLALKYPFLVEMFMFDSYIKGIRMIQSRSNIINELYNREDGGTYLIEAYKNMESNSDNFVKREWIKNSFKLKIVRDSLDDSELGVVESILSEDK